MTHPKAARISPDSKPIAYGAAGLATAIYLGAFATSFFGQASLAQFMLIPQPLQFVAPAVVDLALILFTVATLVRRSRGESTLVTNLATGFWTIVSITANIAHVLIPAGPFSSWSAGTYAGAALSALMPLAALGASLVVENVLIAHPRPAKVMGDFVKPPVAAVSTAPAPNPPVVDGAVTKTQVTAVVTAERPSQSDSQHLPAAPVTPRVEPKPKALATVAAPRTITPKPTARQSASWESLTTEERMSHIEGGKEQGKSWEVIGGEVGVSRSTVKRFMAEQQKSRQLQDA